MTTTHTPDAYLWMLWMDACDECVDEDRRMSWIRPFAT